MHLKNTFGRNIIPENEEERLRALRRYEILDSPPEGAFDKIANLAQKIFKTPIALVALVDENRVFFKANVGMGNTRNLPRGISLCSLAVLQEGVTVFEDAKDDPCLLHNPLVAGSFGLRFYAGAPITTYDGYRVGTVCIVDHTPRLFTDEHRAILEQLADLVMDELELRLSARKAVAKQNEMLHLTIHDLKNPISNIHSLSSLINKKSDEPEKVRSYAALINNTVQTMSGVVQQLLDTSLTSDGENAALKLEQVNLSALLQQAIEENEPNLLKKQQPIHVKRPSEIHLQADPLKIKLLIDNLISNASKYSEAGSAIEVQLEQLDGVARLMVKDNGQGFTEDEKERLFEKHMRLSATPTNNESSTGLGLYIARKIAEQHNGRVWANSEGKNKGSAFFVELPL